MLTGFAIGYSLIFAIAALWHEYVVLKNSKFIPERIILVFAIMCLLFLNNSFIFAWVSDHLPRYYYGENIRIGLIGLTYVLFLNFFLRDLMLHKEYSDKTKRTQVRLLYKLPLFGILGAITVRSFLGYYHLFVAMILVAVLIILLNIVYFKNKIKSIFSILFFALIFVYPLLKILFYNSRYRLIDLLIVIILSFAAFAALRVYRMVI